MVVAGSVSGSVTVWAMEAGDTGMEEMTVVSGFVKAAEADENGFVIDEDGVLTKYIGSGGDVVIPEGVTSIGRAAFFGCSSLTVCYCVEGSYAESYMKENYPKVTYLSIGSENRKQQTITVKDYIQKTYGAKPFSLGAKTDGNGTLTYQSSNEKVATVNAAGKVTLKGYGKITITVIAAATDSYKKAEKKVTLTVLPKTPVITSVKSEKKKMMTVKWKKDAKAAGYIIQYSTDKKFKKDVQTLTIGKNKTVSKLKSGKKYYVRLCAYTNTGDKKIQGAYSAVKQVKCK